MFLVFFVSVFSFLEFLNVKFLIWGCGGACSLEKSRLWVGEIKVIWSFSLYLLACLVAPIDEEKEVENLVT